MKVLIAVDFSEHSNYAYDWLARQKWTDDCEFKVVHALEPVYMSPCIAGAYVQPMLEANNEALKDYRQIVSAKVKELQKRFPPNKVSGTVVVGSPAHVILDEAAAWRADLIVLGSHGRTGVKRFLIGSVAERVAAHADCSVSIVKKPRGMARDEANMNGHVAQRT